MWSACVVLSCHRVFEEISLWSQVLSVQMEALEESQFYEQLRFPKVCFLEGDWYGWIARKDPFVSTSLQYPMLNGLANSWRIFAEVVKLTVGNFRRSWFISTIYECCSGWSICHCCFVIVMSHVACGSMFIEKSLCYGLLFLFSASKLSITFTLLDENWSFLPLHSWKQANLVLCRLCYLQSMWIASQIPCHLVHICLSNFVPKKELSSSNDYSTLSIFTSSKESAFLLLGKCHEEWGNGFVIKCKWYTVVLTRTFTWSRIQYGAKVIVLKFCSASIFFS